MTPHTPAGDIATPPAPPKRPSKLWRYAYWALDNIVPLTMGTFVWSVVLLMARLDHIDKTPDPMPLWQFLPFVHVIVLGTTATCVGLIFLLVLAGNLCERLYDRALAYAREQDNKLDKE